MIKNCDRTLRFGFYRADEPVKAISQLYVLVKAGFKHSSPEHLLRMSAVEFAANYFETRDIESHQLLRMVYDMDEAISRSNGKAIYVTVESVTEILEAFVRYDDELDFGRSAEAVMQLAFSCIGRSTLLEANELKANMSSAYFNRLVAIWNARIMLKILDEISTSPNVVWLDNWRDTKESTQNSLTNVCSSILDLYRTPTQFSRDLLRGYLTFPPHMEVTDPIELREILIADPIYSKSGPLAHRERLYIFPDVQMMLKG